MPPIKGRMMGRMGRAGDNEVQRAVRSLGMTKKKPGIDLSGSSKIIPGSGDASILKLRYPASIRQILPSVKKFRGSSGYMDISDESNSGSDEETKWDEKPAISTVSVKKPLRGSIKCKYFLRSICEHRFNGLIWDVAFSPSGDDIIVSCAEGILVCDMNLHKNQKLDDVILAGGVAFLNDGRLVAVCRNKDTVNVFSSDYSLLHSFSVGSSPMTVSVDCQQRLLICDPGAKSVHIYSDTGEHIESLGPDGEGFSFRWPLYTACNEEGIMYVSDCHAQTVSKFKDLLYNGDTCLNTWGCNRVLRPHGINTYADDVFIIDNATDSVEVFSSKSGEFIQTLVPTEEGQTFRPKVLSLTSKHLIVGGLSGVVKLYMFVTEDELHTQKTPQKTPSKRKSLTRKPSIKKEIKQEGNSDITDLMRDIDSVMETTETLLKSLGETDNEGTDEKESETVNVTNLNEPDDPVILDSDSEDDEKSDDEKEVVTEISFVLEHVDDNAVPQEVYDTEMLTNNGEENKEEIIILDDD